MDKFVKIEAIDLAFYLAEAVCAGRQVATPADEIVDIILAKVKTYPLNTPAEARTGVSDRDAHLAKLMGAAASSLRSAFFRITNNRPEPIAPLETARQTIAQALNLLTNRGNSDD